MAAPITSLTASLQCLLTFNAQQTITGLSKGIRNNDQLAPTASFTVTGAAVANGANQVYSAIRTIAASGTLTIDLSAALTNIVGSATATFARIKAIQVELLSIAQDDTNGTACSSITVGASVTHADLVGLADTAAVTALLASTNAFRSQSSNRGFFSDAISGIDIPNGGFAAVGCDNAGGILVDSTHKNLKIWNNDSGNAAAVRITLIGADA